MGVVCTIYSLSLSLIIEMSFLTDELNSLRVYYYRGYKIIFDIRDDCSISFLISHFSF